MKRPEILIGTRGSALALAQARLVSEAFAREGRSSRLVVIETEGDRRAPDTAWGEGAFVAAIERALLADRVDVAVHSAKDIPTDEHPRLAIGALLPRGDPRDALVVRDGFPARSLETLPAGARVGTDSPRRVGFVLASRPDLKPHSLHGNVDTRLRRLDEGETDALVLAAAGLDRLGHPDRIAERLDPEQIPPAPGQGAIAIQIRRDDARMLALAASIDHGPTRLAVAAERAFLAASGGGCRAPIGALAVSESGEVALFGGYTAPDGSATAFGRAHGSANEVERLGHELAVRLGSRLRSAGRPAVATPAARSEAPPRVLVTRAREQGATLLRALREAGLEAVHVPTISIEPMEPIGPEGDLGWVARELERYEWVVVTSAHGARAIVSAARRLSVALDRPRWAAIGAATGRVLEDEGVHVDLRPGRATATTIADELPVGPGSKVLLVRGDLADGGLPASLRLRGVEVEDVVAYRTVVAPNSSRATLRDATADGPLDGVVFTSGSTVRGLVALAHAEDLDLLSVPAICIGPETAAEARRAGFDVIAEAAMPDAGALAAATVEALRGEALRGEEQELT